MLLRRRRRGDEFEGLFERKVLSIFFYFFWCRFVSRYIACFDCKKAKVKTGRIADMPKNVRNDAFTEQSHNDHQRVPPKPTNASS